MITVIDYGMGNIGSVVRAVQLFTDDVMVSNNPSDIKKSDALIMPGDGAFGAAMANLNERGWTEPLKEYIAGGGYFFGICLGFQLLFSSSEEFGKTDGFNIIEGRVVPFPSESLKVPHMGWNSVKLSGSSKFLSGIEDNSYFYFIHSFYPLTENENLILGKAQYGIEFPCIAGGDSFIATQFHPEKSHRNGLRIMENFIKSVGEK